MPAARAIVLHVQPGCATSAQAEAVLEALAAALDRLAVPPEAELALVLADDTHLQALNRTYRGQDRPTDVLSFPADRADAVPGEPPYLGDILISVAYAGRSAAAAGHDLDAELRLLAVHGLLHLLGHEDESEDGAQTMARLEVELGVRQPGDLE